MCRICSVAECIITYFDGRCPFHFYCSQGTASTEGTVTDASHTLGDKDKGQTGATLEGLVSDAGHAVWDGDRGQTCATTEGIDSDTGHTFGDGDGG